MARLARVKKAPPPPPVEDDPDEDHVGPQRRCIVTRERSPKEWMVRCVVGPDGSIVPDVAAALPGRGLWLTARRDIVNLAVKKRIFDRAAKRSVTVASDLADVIERLLAARCIDTLGLARRAGHGVAGFEKTRTAIAAGRAGAVVAAIDGAADGRRKVAGVAQGLPLVVALDSAEIGAAFGRERMIHAAVGPGPLALRLVVDGARLAGFRGPPADNVL